MPIKRGLYRHFKGQYYKVIDIARHSEDQQDMVIYRALYGDKRVWVRPLSMFVERIERDGKTLPRFEYCKTQSDVLEVAVLNVIEGQEGAFEAAFEKAQSLVAGMQGYITHRLDKCIEQSNQYILLIEWQSLEDHTIGFRQSSEYQQWRSLLHDFYQPFPVVQHYQRLV